MNGWQRRRRVGAGGIQTLEELAAPNGANDCAPLMLPAKPQRPRETAAPEALIVSSGETATGSLQLALSLRGFAVSTQLDIDAARELLRRRRVDLVILDASTTSERAPALQLIADLRAATSSRWPAIWVIVPEARVAEAIPFIDAGADGYLQRPFDATQLRARFAQLERLGTLGEPPATQPQPDATATPAAPAPPAPRDELALLERVPAPVLLIEADGGIAWANAAASSLLGQPGSPSRGANAFALCHPDDVSRVLQLLMRALNHGERGSISARLRRADAGWHDYDVSFGAVGEASGTGAVLMTLHDVSDHKAAEQRLEQQALHDPLTGLANRSLFMEQLERALARSSRFGSDVAVLYIDLDDFKLINDVFGHLAGDEVLRVVAGRLRAHVRSTDTVSRIGGDEFCMLLEDITEPDAIALVVERVESYLRQPVDALGRRVDVSTSIGVAVTRAGSGDATALLDQADRALYRAKAQGKNRAVTFREERDPRAFEPAAAPQPRPLPAPAPEPELTPAHATRSLSGRDIEQLIDRLTRLELQLATLLAGRAPARSPNPHG